MDRAGGENFEYRYQWGDDRAMAIDALAEIADDRSIRILVKALQLESWTLRRRVVRALERVGKPAVPYLIESLESGLWYVREGAAIALGSIGDPGAIEPLIKLLGDSNRSVVEMAKKSINQISIRHG